MTTDTDDNEHLLAAAYALGAVDPDEARDFEEHLETCAACRQEVAGFTATTTLLAQAVAEPVPVALLDRVLAEARQTPQLPPIVPEDEAGEQADPMTPRAIDNLPVAPIPPGATVHALRSRSDRRIPRAVSALLAVAAAVVILLVGVTVVGNRTTGPDEVAQVVESPGVVSYRMEGGNGAVADIHLTSDVSKAAVVATGLPALDASKTYELWFIAEENGRRVPHRAAVFSPDADGNARAAFTPPVRSMEAMAVTVEPAGGTDAPTTEPAMVIEA